MGLEHWIELGLSKNVCKRLVALGYDEPMAVQKSVVPLFISNKDVVVEAVTGSGKTLAFLLPIFQKMLNADANESRSNHSSPTTHSLVIAPTRDLATQIHNVAKNLLRKSSFTSCVIFGGAVTCQQNIARFMGEKNKPADLVISTPGRFVELLHHETGLGKFKDCFRNIEVLVLDEADRLLDLGFHDDLTRLLECLPKQRRTGLFSATQTKHIEDIIRAGLRNPVRLTLHSSITSQLSSTSSSVAAEKCTPAKLENFYVECTGEQKLDLLFSFLNQNRKSKILLFFATSCQVRYFTLFLNKFLANINILMIHGKMKKKRNKIVEKFTKMSHGILLTTDLLSRGIDIDNIDWVVQYDAPSCATNFVHRCGRTARAQKAGRAIIFLMPNEIEFVAYLSTCLKAPLSERVIEVEEEFKHSAQKLKEMAHQDREILESGTRAFVSFVQSYKKHDCSSIFNIKNLNFGQIANGFGLLRLPKMPELGKRDISAFERSEVDTSSIKFVNNEKKEIHRLDKIAEIVEKKAKKAQLIKQGKIEKQRNKKLKQIKKSISSKVNKNFFTRYELDELKRDSSLLKKSKKKRLNDEQLLHELDCEIT